jgi:hypothetical protein
MNLFWLLMLPWFGALIAITVLVARDWSRRRAEQRQWAMDPVRRLRR